MSKKGYKQTKEHRRKIGDANKKGHYIKCIQCGNDIYITPWEENRKPPKKYCNRECFKKYYKINFAKRGKDNKFWKNGSFPYTKREVLKRDKHTCKDCGFSEIGIMEVHHQLEVHYGGKHSKRNCITLCPNCHRRRTNQFLKNKAKDKKQTNI